MKSLFGLLAKFPEPGTVKTRLAREIGARPAAGIYRSIAERVFINTLPEGPGFERVVFYSPVDALSRFEEWLPGERFLPQSGGDIGEIMIKAIQDLFDLGASKAVIAGVDIPGLRREIVRDAFLKLDISDVVIGPATDGGYYLIGMKAASPGCFRNISWSTAQVFDETIRNIRELGLKYSTVEVLSDVDRIEDISGLSFPVRRF